jgi:hypothetical protein
MDQDLSEGTLDILKFYRDSYPSWQIDSIQEFHPSGFAARVKTATGEKKLLIAAGGTISLYRAQDLEAVLDWYKRSRQINSLQL